MNEYLERIEKFLNNFSLHSPNGPFFSSWPVIVTRWHNKDKENGTLYEYKYPSAFFRALSSKYNLHVLSLDKNKSERIHVLKLFIDKLINGEIDIFVYHFGLYLVYKDYYYEHRIREDLTEESIGKKRFEFIKTLPEIKYMDTDDFISAVWSDLIEHKEGKTGDYRVSPYMSKVRILFDAYQFENYTGIHYPDADWVEPESGSVDLRCKIWTKEEDPMAKISTLPQGWVEGPIYYGSIDSNGSCCHFVQNTRINCGSLIQVKFGKGFIEGRYECDLANKGPILIYRGDEYFIIPEGHKVRIKRV
ncbi:hypothetical protein [Dehalobacter sp. TeCB1]|uniref:hypothetical protein n=1 Tax=Dehalobacter sp. TeCB1 TaxID=1843715 RepID=UPI00083A761A|nr:hypothetical protein [Dehalobacter sp. TeCB1]OCZ50842.1 hypothetical protein A7D23_14170 [Dehalobacter sp. TeCB1]